MKHLFLGALILSIASFTSFGADSDQPQSPSAIAAIKEYDKAIKAADDARAAAAQVANRKLVEKLKIAANIATKAGNGKEADAIKSRIAELNSPPGAGPALTGLQRKSLEDQRAVILSDAKGITDTKKKLAKLLEATQISLQLDPRAGSAEIEGIVKQAMAAGDQDYAGIVLITEGQFFADSNDWARAEIVLSRVWKDLRGNYGDHGCQAAAIMADHFDKDGKTEIVAKYKTIIVECGGSYNEASGNAELWLADYHLSKNDRARAVVELKDVYKNRAGGNDSCKKKAKEKLLGLGEVVKE